MWETVWAGPDKRLGWILRVKAWPRAPAPPVVEGVTWKPHRCALEGLWQERQG